ncbi:hypothetical protein ACEWY4_017541 [Coilia grayii]|uniref:Hydroperoxide isomerase ALOXE3-like n=1 Tax=Coilia grayii TaxID=363190 RepID=A0ABD1JH56_9TELE
MLVYVLLCLHFSSGNTQFVNQTLANTEPELLNYTLTVYTGDGPLEGTTNYISVVLHGAEGVSEPARASGFLGLRRGSVRQFHMNLFAPLGDLIMLEVYSKALFGFDNKWFCDKFSVKTPENEELLFPCYRWINASTTLFLRPAAAIFEFQDVHAVGQNQRRMELEQSRSTYRWRIYVKGIPETVMAETSQDLPTDAQYSIRMATDFRMAYRVTTLETQALANSRQQWDWKFSGLDNIFSEERSLTYEYVKEHWDKDEFFGYQFLNGLNPMVIRRCSKLPQNFPVTEEMVRDSLGGTTLEQEMKKGNIFLSDYKVLDGLIGNIVHGRQQYLTSPLVLLYSNPEGQMLPIAIQLTQEAGTKGGAKGKMQNPIFLPTDSKYDWLLAKVFVRGADFAMHEMIVHLLGTHFLAEVFTMATLRNLPSTHPLYKLIIPHTRYTLQVSVISRSQLISKQGPVTQYTGIGGQSLPVLLTRATASLTYSSLCLPDSILERGLEQVSSYYYRDDGMELWRIINKFVEGILTHYYTSDEHIGRDAELQNWITEIFTKGFLGRSQSGIPQSFNTRAELVKFVTMVIFTSTAQHAAVHNGQFDLGGWMPNFPSSLREPPPTEKGQSTMDTILNTLPDEGTTANILAVLKHVTEDYSDLYPLGYFPEDLFGEEVPRKLIENFQKDLEVLSDVIEKRNAKLELPYTFLHPKNIVNSIST